MGTASPAPAHRRRRRRRSLPLLLGTATTMTKRTIRRSDSAPEDEAPRIRRRSSRRRPTPASSHLLGCRCPTSSAVTSAAMLLVSLVVLTVAEHPEPKYYYPGYYDDLRRNVTSSAPWSRPPNMTVGSNVMEYFPYLEEANDSAAAAHAEEETSFRLADVPVFLPYTLHQHGSAASSAAVSANGDVNTDDGTTLKRLRSSVLDDAFAVLLAVEHFNAHDANAVLTRLDDADVAALSQCNVRLTTELLDTRLSPLRSTSLLSTLLERDPHSSIIVEDDGDGGGGGGDPTAAQPLPVAFVGAYRDASTSPLSILGGVHSIPSVGYQSSSTDLNVKGQHPYHGRVNPDSNAEARATVRYLQRLGVKHVNVLFVADAFGSSYSTSFRDEASKVTGGMESESASFSYFVPPPPPSSSGSGNGGSDGYTNDEVTNAIRSLALTQYRYFVVAIGEEHYGTVMTAANDAGLVGKGYVWFFTSGLELGTFQREVARYEPGSALAQATDSIGVIRPQGGTIEDTLLPDPEDSTTVPPAVTSTSSGYDRLRAAWYEAALDSDLTAYFKSKQPLDLTEAEGYDPDSFEFSKTPSHLGPFLYDGVWALGLAMCRTAGSYFFSGPDVFTSFAADGVQFEGATGEVVVDELTGTRDGSTVVYTAWNVRAASNLDGDGNVAFDLIPSAHFERTAGEEPTWAGVLGNAFLYADGTTNPPLDLPLAEEDENHIGTAGRIVGYVLMGIVVVLAISSAVWTVAYRASRVVRASRPAFLFTVGAGCLVMSSAIVPLGLEEPVSEDGLDKACMAGPWLVVMGFVVLFAALFTKTWRINKKYRHPELDITMVSPLDIFKIFLVLFVPNFVLLLSWTLAAPLEWDRIYTDGKDRFERPIESYGVCKNDDAIPFVALLVVLNLAALVLASWQAYKARDVETEYQESRYVSISLASILQALCMGIPIMIVVEESPQARFYVEVGIIFITCTAVLLLVFVPKVISIRTDRVREEEDARRRTRRSTWQYGAGAADSQRSSIGDSSTRFSGHAPTSAYGGTTSSVEARSSVASYTDGGTSTSNVGHSKGRDENVDSVDAKPSASTPSEKETTQVVSLDEAPEAGEDTAETKRDC